MHIYSIYMYIHYYVNMYLSMYHTEGTVTQDFRFLVVFFFMNPLRLYLSHTLFFEFGSNYVKYSKINMKQRFLRRR